MSTQARQVRSELERAGSLRWFHWGALALSLAATFGAWQVSRGLVEESRRERFEREASGVVDLVVARLQGYEDALRREAPFEGSGTAAFAPAELVEGGLRAQDRGVGVRIREGDEVLYDELTAESADYDPEPLFTTRRDESVSGRSLSFDLQSSRSFRASAGSWLPTGILLGAAVVDGVLVGLFVLLARANRRVLAHADAVSEELQWKGRELEASNSELERFAYIASHDLQEPLRMVSSFAELLNEEYEDAFEDEGRRWLGFMVDGARRMQELVRGLLEYSRAGGPRGEPSTVSMNTVVEAAVARLGPEIDEARAVVRADDLPGVLGHERDLVALLVHLLSNAIKFQDGSEAPTVQVESRWNGDRHEFCVRDNGIGIAPDGAEGVFTIFKRFHGRAEYAGVGVGLSICKRVVERHGGEVWFRSEPGAGTEFYFTLIAEPADTLPRRGCSERQPETLTAT